MDSATHLKRSLRRGRHSFANCSVALRSSSGSVRCIKHNYPDHRDKSERQKRVDNGISLLPVVVFAPPIIESTPAYCARSGGAKNLATASSAMKWVAVGDYKGER